MALSGIRERGPHIKFNSKRISVEYSVIQLILFEANGPVINSPAGIVVSKSMISSSSFTRKSCETVIPMSAPGTMDGDENEKSMPIRGFNQGHLPQVIGHMVCPGQQYA
jgi:hypothetical protein